VTDQDSTPLSVIMPARQSPASLEQLLEILEEQAVQSREGKGYYLHCRECGHRITMFTETMRVDNQHRFMVVSPSNNRFQIGCFRDALGCSIHGHPDSTHSWFEGYAWCFAHCGNCESHLGWYYQSLKQEYFFGLMIDRLVEQRPRQPSE